MAAGAGSSLDSMASGSGVEETGKNLDQIRDAAKWLLAAGGTVFAAIIAGVQIKGLQGLFARPAYQQWLALVAAIVAVGLTLGLVGFCAQVLTVGRYSIRDLSERELAAGHRPGDVQIERIRDELISQVYRRRSHLLGSYPDLGTLYRDFLQRPSVPADAAVARVENWVHLYRARTLFRRFRVLGFLGGVLLAVAVLALAFLAVDPDRSAAVSAPASGTLVLHPGGKGSLPSSCVGKTLRGFAVGGTYQAPVFVVIAPPGCDQRILSPRLGAAVFTPDK